ncbi:M3 family metallopeptidase [Thioalkalivibrio sp. XN8]|uniref:M3 family metallopeptidase n=1 Tax=Thioalkalivibrio sp. XN8 TaxID=2712863 RepID=UPI0013EAAB1A|nr:M3 family metallopeptidase [Thioalkalivibrio sp. XN8]NGP53032.1 M3 family metallopeptidase [Thioalkalivibrio sp. XN8]
MSRRFALPFALAAAAAFGGYASQLAAEQPAAADAAANPFFTASALPYQVPPFDQIRDEHYLPAFERGMAEELAEIEAIANNPEAPTFENTIVAMEQTGEILARVSRVFFNLNSAHTNPAMQDVQKTVSPQLAAHRDAIFLNPTLFARVEALHGKRAELGLDPESLRLLERYYIDFVRAGARLSEEDKDKLRAINAELASLGTTFAQNVLRETLDSAVIVDTAEELDGFSDAQIRAAAEAATARGHEGKYLISLQNTSGQPPLALLTNRALRQRIHEASLNRGARDNEHDNRPVVARVAALRAERAALLGYPNHAAFVLENATAGTPDAVNEMLGGLAPAAVANARKEAADIQALIEAQGGDFELQAWDWDFYAEQVKQARYDLDPNELRAYFELESVLNNGVFYAANKVFGLTFKPRPDLPLYHPDARAWEVFEEDGTPLGIFIGDFYARDSKRGGAWMNAYVPQNGLEGNKAVVANHQNIPKPPEGEPTLMTFDEVVTMFHEFGHAVHGLFSDVRYPRFSGTSVPRDFVEFPSQVYEMWADWPTVLANYARHYETGELLPKEMLEKALEAQKFNEGFRTTEYVAASLIDQAWHQRKAGDVPTDTVAFEQQVLADTGMDFAPVPPRYRSTYFSHIMGGYSAGYYSYIWSEVLDADAVAWFKENGGMTRENGEHFRASLLARGGSKDAMELYRDFAGRDPEIRHLLERRGLTAAGSGE